MKSTYKTGGRIAPYAKGKEKVITEAKDRSEGAVLSAEASKAPMAVAATGGKTRMRLDRPGRKMGGRVGADCSPLSSAAKTS